MALDSNNVPECLVGLLPLAEKWGSGDDLQRSELVQSASVGDLSSLIDAVRSHRELFEWLAGPESYAETSSDEYIAMSNLVSAFEYAKVLVKRRSN